MAAAPANSADAAKADAFIGSLISLITKYEIRYEGFLFQLNPQESTIGLRNVRSFGTEGRRMDGTHVAPSDRIYEYICFRGSDIKDLWVISAPPIESTPTVPDDPAIIQSHNSQLPLNISLVSPTSLGGSSNTNLDVQVPPFQGSMTPLQSMDVSGSWASLVPPAQVNISGPGMQSYWPGLTGLPGGNSHFQHPPFPPPPPALLLGNPIHLQLPHPNVNASLAGNALNFSERPHPPLPPVCTGPLNLISTISTTSTAQYSHIPLSTIFSNLSSAPMSHNASIALQTEMVQSGPQMVSSSITTFDINPVVPLVTSQAQSLLGPAPFPVILKTPSSTVSISSTSHGKALVVPPTNSRSFQHPGFMQPSSSGYLKAGNSGTNVILPSAPNLPPSYSENVDESAMQLPKSPARKLHQGASSYHHVSRHNGLIRGDVMHGGMCYPHQGYRGPAQGRGRGILPNGAAPQYYQTYRGRPVGRGSGMIGPATYPRHIARGWPKNFTPHHRHSVGTPAWGGNQAEIDFSKDFDFEAMNEKFNKEEVWDLLGKKDQKAGPEDENEGDGGEEDETVEPMVKHKPSYSKEAFFDSISCGALDAELAKDKKNSEARNAHAQTFGEIQGVPQPDHGTLRPPRGGASRGTYRGRGYDHGEAVWSRVA